MERKRWEKHEFPPRAAPEAKPDPVLAKQLQYIKVLEERNRVKKRLAAASKRNDRLQEREEAFVTAFNVPRAQTAARTKAAPKAEPPRPAKSAPTTLNFTTGGDEKAEPRARAKWSRPQAPMSVAVEHQDGVPLFRLTTSDEKEAEEEEESYLDESFEEFEEEAPCRELVIEEDEPEEKETTISRTEAPTSPTELSRTTSELFGLIQHLSRSKQRALADVLQQFQASDQRESDVKALQSSIGDPAIWKEITASLNLPVPAPSADVAVDASTQDRPSVAPLQHVLEEQLQWEDRYANEVKQGLERDREEKQRILTEAEERRAAMMRQLEDEEKEIERLMEIKRRERLEKLRALQEEVDAADRLADAVRRQNTKGNASSTDGPSTTQAEPKLRTNDGGLAQPEDAKVSSLPTQVEKASASVTGEQAKPHGNLVPPLQLSAAVSSSPVKTELVEIQIKLLSTWSRTRAVGLTQICVYDSNGDELAVDPEDVRLCDHPNGKPFPSSNDMVRGISRLFNGVAHTNAEKDMWLGRLGDSGILLVGFNVSSTPSKLCVWNYNSKSHTACTRDIEVFVGGRCVWTGSLPETFGDPDDNVCTWIDLLGSAKKTSRTARQLDNAEKAEAKAPAPWLRESVQVDKPNAVHDEQSNGNTPMWLSSRTSLSTETLKASRSTIDLDTWSAEEKPGAGSATSRRRQQKALHTSSTVETTRETEEDAKVTPLVQKETEESKETQRRKEMATSASLLPWDSLEKFSKTTRSRLPQTTEVEMPVLRGTDTLEAKGTKAETRVFTTSALLTELRQGTSGDPYRYADPLPTYRSPTEKEANDALPTANSTEIPVLPSGRVLKIEILSTWGDPYYVGLNGVEIFDDCGELVRFHDPVTQVTARPESINVLEENSNDPRVPKNLVDGVNFTCDDFHMWLAPFTQGEEHFVSLEMNAPTAISMVRIWNYNKSRTHTSRGVREARLVLYDTPGGSSNVVFEGEIRQAPGLVNADSVELSNEVILFTQEPAILEAIEANDEALRELAREQEREEEETHQVIERVHRSIELRRPRTSDAGSRTVDASPTRQENDDGEQRQPRFGQDGRPMTTATRSQTRLRTSIDTWVAEEPQQRSPDAAKVSEAASTKGLASDYCGEENLVRCRRITLQLHSTWGDRNYVGLTQLEVLVGTSGTPIPLDASNVNATPRDLASLGYTGDPRTLDKLIDGTGTTCDDTHMWLVPLQSGAVPEVRVEFKVPQHVYGLRVWNYNKSPEDTYRGVKQLVVMLDGAVISPQETGFLLRKAPGVADFNFAQTIKFPVDRPGASVSAYVERVRYPFSVRAYKTPIIRQDYEAPLYPQGFMLRIVCWSTWGDPYYLGLNGLELYDYSGARIRETPAVTTAIPYSVAELDNGSGVQRDARTPENLMSGQDKNTWEAHDAWLAPLASSLGNQQGNIIYIGFDAPVVISMIKFWNYAKSPERGVKDVDIYLDDLHIFSGTLRKAPAADTGGNSRFSKVHKVTEQFGQPVLFSCNQAQVDAEKRSVPYCGTEEQDVLGINEGQVMQESRAMYRKPDPGAEGVVVDLDCRPMTAVCRQ